MSKQSDRTTWYHGKQGKKYGIWNNMSKEFQFGICEDTPMLAQARLFQKIGDDARKWRFETKEIPAIMLTKTTREQLVITKNKEENHEKY